MVKRIFMVVIVAVVAMSLIIGGCAAPAPTPAPAPPAAPAPAPAPPKVIELKFTTTVPDVTLLGRGQKAWMEKVEKDSGGRIKFTPYWASSLFKPREIFRGALDGLADFIYWSPNIELGLMPLTSVMWLPMMGFPSQWAQRTIYAQLLEKFPQMKAEYQGLMVYGIHPSTPAQLNTLKKEVRVPADLRGMKITPANEEIAQMVVASGGAPVNLVVTDWYTSLERGVTEGMINSTGALFAFKTFELMKYHAQALPGGFAQTPFVVLVNPENWKKIPPDLQKVLKDNEEFYSEQTMSGMAAEEQAGLAYAKKNEHVIVTLTPAEFKQWADLAQPIHDAWISKNAAKGSKEIYDTIKKMISEYKGK